MLPHYHQAIGRHCCGPQAMNELVPLNAPNCQHGGETGAGSDAQHLAGSLASMQRMPTRQAGEAGITVQILLNSNVFAILGVTLGQDEENQKEEKRRRTICTALLPQAAPSLQCYLKAASYATPPSCQASSTVHRHLPVVIPSRSTRT